VIRSATGRTSLWNRGRLLTGLQGHVWIQYLVRNIGWEMGQRGTYRGRGRIQSSTGAGLPGHHQPRRQGSVRLPVVHLRNTSLSIDTFGEHLKTLLFSAS